jgi:predicted transcriptional regulator
MTRGTKDIISAAQLRAARGLLNWSRRELAARAQVGTRTVARIEDGDVRAQKGTMDALQATLESAGVVLIPENGGGAGVRLRMAARLR